MMTNKGTKFFRSLRFRILIILIIVGIVPGIVVTAVVTMNYKNRAIEVRTASISKQCGILCTLLITENYLNDPSSEVVNNRLEQLSEVYRGRIVLADRDFRIVRDTYGTDEGKLLVSSMAVRCMRGEKASNYDDGEQLIEMALPIRSPEVKQPQGILLVNVSTNEVQETIRQMHQTGFLIVLLIVAACILASLILSTILVKPFARITKSIEDLTDGYQNDTISVPDYTETALITDAFNKIYSRMKMLDESRQEFVSNVSHELKTPMTSMKVLADSLVGQEGVPEELYQDFLKDITMEIDRENKIITDLLSLVKLDKKASDVHISRTNINLLLESVLKRLRPIANEHKIDLILDSYRPVEADVDEVKFTLAISNLVENGIKYNVEEGWVRVTLNADGKDFFVKVSDSGLGIPEESIDRIFERFYRVDKSHSREIGGTGLGLAITRGVIGMHHGTIKVESKEGEGTAFLVRIPLIYVPDQPEPSKTGVKKRQFRRKEAAARSERDAAADGRDAETAFSTTPAEADQFPDVPDVLPDQDRESSAGKVEAENGKDSGSFRES